MSTIRVDNFGPSAGGTTYSARGIAKAWVNLNGLGTIAVLDSLIVSSLTDNGTGDYYTNFSSDFANTNFATTTAQGSADTGIHRDRMFNERANDGVSRTVSRARMISMSSQGSGNAYAEDNERLFAAFHGDLA